IRQPSRDGAACGYAADQPVSLPPSAEWFDCAGVIGDVAGTEMLQEPGGVERSLRCVVQGDHFDRRRKRKRQIAAPTRYPGLRLPWGPEGDVWPERLREWAPVHWRRMVGSGRRRRRPERGGWCRRTRRQCYRNRTIEHCTHPRHFVIAQAN